MKVYVLASWDSDSGCDQDVNVDGVFISSDDAKSKIMSREKKIYRAMSTDQMVELIEEDERFDDCQDNFIPWERVKADIESYMNDRIIQGLYRYYEIFEREL